MSEWLSYSVSVVFLGSRVVVLMVTLLPLLFMVLRSSLSLLLAIGMSVFTAMVGSSYKR